METVRVFPRNLEEYLNSTNKKSLTYLSTIWRFWWRLRSTLSYRIIFILIWDWKALNALIKQTLESIKWKKKQTKYKQRLNVMKIFTFSHVVNIIPLLNTDGPILFMSFLIIDSNGQSYVQVNIILINKSRRAPHLWDQCFNLLSDNSITSNLTRLSLAQTVRHK
jgi:hypothetical protein